MKKPTVILQHSPLAGHTRDQALEARVLGRKLFDPIQEKLGLQGDKCLPIDNLRAEVSNSEARE